MRFLEEARTVRSPWRRPSVSRSGMTGWDAAMRMALVAHESLHTFGLDHDPTLTEH